MKKLKNNGIFLKFENNNSRIGMETIVQRIKEDFSEFLKGKPPRNRQITGGDLRREKVVERETDWIMAMFFCVFFFCFVFNFLVNEMKRNNNKN